jgi:hypothetical protein
LLHTLNYSELRVLVFFLILIYLFLFLYFLIEFSLFSLFSQVLMARTTAKMETSEQRRAPPPPPPRGVTLRTTSSVVATTPTGATHPPSLIPISTSSAANRLHIKSTHPLTPIASNPLTKVLMKEHLPAELVTASPVQQQQQHPQGYLETRYAYSVNGILGSAAQASAAAAFFAR